MLPCTLFISFLIIGGSIASVIVVVFLSRSKDNIVIEKYVPVKSNQTSPAFIPSDDNIVGESNRDDATQIYAKFNQKCTT